MTFSKVTKANDNTFSLHVFAVMNLNLLLIPDQQLSILLKILSTNEGVIYNSNVMTPSDGPLNFDLKTLVK